MAAPVSVASSTHTFSKEGQRFSHVTWPTVLHHNTHINTCIQQESMVQEIQDWWWTNDASLIFSEIKTNKYRKMSYLSQLKFPTGHYYNLKPRSTIRINMYQNIIQHHVNTGTGGVICSSHTFVLYSQSILKKSSNVWGKGPWVAM